MKVKEFIEHLQTLDQDANIWVMYDPPFACMEPQLTHLVEGEEWYARMYPEKDVRIGDYAIICG